MEEIWANLLLQHEPAAKNFSPRFSSIMKFTSLSPYRTHRFSFLAKFLSFSLTHINDRKIICRKKLFKLEQMIFLYGNWIKNCATHRRWSWFQTEGHTAELFSLIHEEPNFFHTQEGEKKLFKIIWTEHRNFLPAQMRRLFTCEDFDWLDWWLMSAIDVCKQLFRM